MVQVVLAPCSPFSVTSELMKESAVLARKHGVHLHTHLAETQDEEDFCIQKLGYRPVEYMQVVDWVGKDVWYAHSVHVSKEEIELFAREGCGVAHCPSSNMRLASGIAPIMEYLKAGVNVGVGVDGSASNDGSHLLAEARQAMLLARLGAGLKGASLSSTSSEILTARQALELATRGGAAVLGRSDIGSLEAGKCADFISFNLSHLDFTGALHDPLAALVFCEPHGVDYNYVHGKAVVREGVLLGLDLRKHIEKHNQASTRLLIG
jgi:cytosine/adenosine deaminase-related metal-dependent hydrolase